MHISANPAFESPEPLFGHRVGVLPGDPYDLSAHGLTVEATVPLNLEPSVPDALRLGFQWADGGPFQQHGALAQSGHITARLDRRRLPCGIAGKRAGGRVIGRLDRSSRDA